MSYRANNICNNNEIIQMVQRKGVKCFLISMIEMILAMQLNVIQENSNNIVVMYKCHGYHTKSGNTVSYVRFTEGFASQQFPRNDILRV